jgi:ribonuclease E
MAIRQWQEDVMPNIRLMAAATTIIAALSFGSAPARACDAGAPGCTSASAAQPKTPLRLNQFLKRPAQPKAASIAQTSAPTAHTSVVAASKRARNAKTRTRVAAKEVSSPAAVSPPVTSFATPTPAPAELLRMSDAAPPPAAAPETDGVALASADEFNELDAAADQVQVVAANEVNELDLAADTPVPAQAAPANQTPPAAENAAAMTAMASADQPAPRSSWVAWMFVALGGMIAAGAAVLLFFVAQAPARRPA